MWQTNCADDVIGWRHCSRPTWSTLKSKSTSWPYAAAVAANCQNCADLYQHNSSLTLTSSLTTTPLTVPLCATLPYTNPPTPSRKCHKRDEDKPFRPRLHIIITRRDSLCACTYIYMYKQKSKVFLYFLWQCEF